MTNPRGCYGWAAASFRVEDRPHFRSRGRSWRPIIRTRSGARCALAGRVEIVLPPHELQRRRR